MVKKNNFRLALFVFFLISFIVALPAFAEIKFFEKETTWRAAKNQSQEQAEGLAKLEAQRLAIEEAGVFISTLTVVKDYKLEKDEITQLASGILHTKTVGDTVMSIENGVFCVRVKTVIQVDTSVLDRLIEDFMKDKGALKREEEALKKVRELENKLANLKSSEVKRVEEMTAEAIRLARDSDRQRVFREEQALKARGEFSRAEAERFARDREMQERRNRILFEQEKAAREAAALIATEQDNLKRANLENEKRWNDIARKSQLEQSSWVPVDDSLSLKQALTDVKDLKRDIANLKTRLDFQYNENTKNLKAAYAQQRNLTKMKFPLKPAVKDAFESTAEYNDRIALYERKLEAEDIIYIEALEKLKRQETQKLAEAEVEYIGRQVRVIAPYVKRLQDLQVRKFNLPEGGTMTVELGVPDADNNRFSLNLKHNGKSWSKWWTYTDRNNAKDFYQTRTYLKAEGLFQIEEAAQLIPILTAARVTHLATKETRDFVLETPTIFAEIKHFEKLKEDEATAQKINANAARRLALNITGRDGRFIVFSDGTVQDTWSDLMWAAKDNGSNINWEDAAKYCESYRAGGYTDWHMPTSYDLEKLYDVKMKYKGKYKATDLIQVSDCCLWISNMNEFKNATNYLDITSFDIIKGKWLWTHLGSKGNRVLPVRVYR